jgi:hypothetical protein
MNSQSKQCPTCGGNGYLHALVHNKDSTIACPECQGTRVALPADPTTAGSGPPAGSHSRRRSLPGLARVRVSIVSCLRDARLLLQSLDRDAPPCPGEDPLEEYAVALEDVLWYVDSRLTEAPEANPKLSGA